MKSLIFSILLLVSTVSLAKWPTEPITIIVPAAVGGGSDTMARIMSVKLEKMLGVPVIVRNMPGGNEVVAARHVTGEANNNHTFIMNDAIWASATYFADPHTVNQFKMLNIFATSPLCLSSRIGISHEDFLKANKHRASANVGGNGTNSPQFIWLNNIGTGIQWNEIPYAGSGPLMIAMAGNQVDYGIVTIGSTKTMMDAGKVRCQMIGTEKRHPLFPEVPTYRELGFKGEPGYHWWSFVARNDTSAEAMNTFSLAIKTLVKDGETLKTLEKQGMLFEYVSAENAENILRKDIEKYSKFRK